MAAHAISHTQTNPLALHRFMKGTTYYGHTQMSAHAQPQGHRRIALIVASVPELLGLKQK